MSSIMLSTNANRHARFDSAVFTLTEQLDFFVNVVTPNFLQNSTVDCSQNASIADDELYSSANDRSAAHYEKTPLYFPSSHVSYEESDMYWYKADACNVTEGLHTAQTQGAPQRLDNQECINAFGASGNFQGKQGDVLVVTKEQPEGSNATILLNFRLQMYASNYIGNNWVCDPAYLMANNYKCKVRDIANDAENWTLGPIQADDTNLYRIKATDEWEIDYCLTNATEVGRGCQLQYSPTIMIIVIFANATKLSCIVFFLKTTTGPILATTGDGMLPS